MQQSGRNSHASKVISHIFLQLEAQFSQIGHRHHSEVYVNSFPLFIFFLVAHCLLSAFSDTK